MANSTKAVKRILVPMDGSPLSQEAMRVAVELARGGQTEVIGLFVEDIELLNWSELPFAHEVDLYSPTVRPVKKDSLERQLRVQAEQLRRNLGRLAKAARVDWSFDVVRGNVPYEVLSASQRADLTVLGKGRPLGVERQGVGSTVRYVLDRGEKTVFILCCQGQIPDPVVVVYTGSALSRQALFLASWVMAKSGLGMKVLIPAPLDSDFESVRAEVSRSMTGKTELIQIQRLQSFASEVFDQVLCGLGNGPLVLPCEGALQGDCLQGLLSKVSNPVLLVRSLDSGSRQEGLRGPTT